MAITDLAQSIRIVAILDTDDDAPIPPLTNGEVDGIGEAYRPAIQQVGSTSGNVNPVNCSAEIRGTSITICDMSAWFTHLMRDWEMRERIITLWCGFEGEDFADYEVVFKGRVSRLACARPGTWTLSVDDLRRSLKTTIFNSATEADPVVIEDENPIDILIDQLITSLEIPAELVDVAGMEDIRDAYFSALEFSFSITSPEEAKEWLEAQICLPLGLYFSTLPSGAITLRTTQPPTGAEATGAPMITGDHIIGDVRVSLDLRDLLNEIRWQYDGDIEYYVDSGSLTKFRQSRGLEIDADGLVAAFSDMIDIRNAQLFARFADPYPYYRLTTTMRHCRLQPGELVALQPSQTPNLATGTLEYPGPVFCEVLSVNVNPHRATVDLTLVGTPFAITRTGVISDLDIDYGDATTEQRETYCWISDEDGILDGEDGYVILGS